jgi:hypothetical protein
MDRSRPVYRDEHGFSRLQSGNLHAERKDSATYLVVSIHPVPAVGLVGDHFPFPLVDCGGLVAVEEVVFDPDSVWAVVGDTGHCMPLPGSIGLAAEVGGLGLGELVSNSHSYLGGRHVVAYSPIRLDHSGHYPIAHCLPGRNRNHSTADHTDCPGCSRSPAAAAAAAAAFAVAVLGHNVAVAGVRTGHIAAGMPFRRC